MNILKSALIGLFVLFSTSGTTSRLCMLMSVYIKNDHRNSFITLAMNNVKLHHSAALDNVILLAFVPFPCDDHPP